MSLKPMQIAAGLAQAAKGKKTAAIILAAGQSTRMGGKTSKQFQEINGMPVLAHTLLAYQKCPLISKIVVVSRPQDFKAIAEMRQQYGFSKLKHLVAGGATRQQSARNGMKKIDEDIRYVAIADGARCLVTPEQITNVCLFAYRHQAASAGHQINDTVKRTTTSGMTCEMVDRKNLWQAQTPQVFHTSLYIAAMYQAQKDRFDATDDNALIEHLGYRVKMVECGRENIKITTPEDIPLAETILQKRG